MSSNEPHRGADKFARPVARRHIEPHPIGADHRHSEQRRHHAPPKDDVDVARSNVQQVYSEPQPTGSVHKDNRPSRPHPAHPPRDRHHFSAQHAPKHTEYTQRRRTQTPLHKISTAAKTMFRLRHYFQFAIIIICLSWGGYQITHSVLAQPLEASSTGTSVVVDGQTLDSRYPGLPTDVAAIVRSVVATQRITAGNGSATQSGMAGSGVVISDTEVLTAGHNVEDGKGLACSQTLIVSAGVLSSANATKDLVTHASVEYGKKDDIAVLTVNPGANFKALPDIKLATVAIQPGEAVYFINFQPSVDGKGRTPLAADKTYAEPAIFSATVLGSSDHGLAVATGGGKSFGRGVSDVMLRRGASGGAVVNAKGELVGLSVSSESLEANRTAPSLLKEYNVNLDAGKYQVAYVQQADKALLSRLQSGMVSCAGVN